MSIYRQEIKVENILKTVLSSLHQDTQKNKMDTPKYKNPRVFFCSFPKRPFKYFCPPVKISLFGKEKI